MFPSGQLLPRYNCMALIVSFLFRVLVLDSHFLRILILQLLPHFAGVHALGFLGSCSYWWLIMCLNSCFSENVFNLPAYVVDSSAGYIILGCTSFCLTILKSFFHCFQTSRFVVKKYVMILFHPLCQWCFLPPQGCLQDFFFYSLVAWNFIKRDCVFAFNHSLGWTQWAILSVWRVSYLLVLGYILWYEFENNFLSILLPSPTPILFIYSWASWVNILSFLCFSS